MTGGLATMEEIYDAFLAAGGTVVLDFDGVVADTEPLHREAYVDLLTSYGVSENDLDFGKYVGHTELEIYRLIEADFGIKMDDSNDKQYRLRDVLARVLKSNLRPSFIVDFLIRKEVSPLHILSSQDRDFIAKLLGVWGIQDYCQIFRDTERWGGKFGTIDHLAEVLKCKPAQIFHFEDSPTAVTRSRASGHRTVYVRNMYNKDKDAQADWELDISVVERS